MAGFFVGGGLDIFVIPVREAPLSKALLWRKHLGTRGKSTLPGLADAGRFYLNIVYCFFNIQYSTRTAQFGKRTCAQEIPYRPHTGQRNGFGKTAVFFG